MRAGSAVSSLSLNSGCEGLGLGLNVSFNLVQCLGGELKISAHPGGTTLRFTISLTTPQDQVSESPGLPLSTHRAAQVLHSAPVDTVDNDNWNGSDVPVISDDLKGRRKSGSAWVFRLPKLLTMQRANQGNAPKENSVRSRFSILSRKGQDQSYQWQPVVVSEVATAFMKKTENDNSGYRKLNKYATGVGLEATRAAHILLVEDNTICQRVTQHGLRRLGCECDIAGNGRIAVQALQGHDNMYDLIIMDLRMPEMDGLQATSYIRNKLGLKVPILGFSAEITQQMRDECIAVGMQGFLPKPASIDTLGSEIQSLIPHLSITLPSKKLCAQ
jgi:CheY-like chemotaxis protein